MVMAGDILFVVKAGNKDPAVYIIYDNNGAIYDYVTEYHLNGVIQELTDKGVYVLRKIRGDDDHPRYEVFDYRGIELFTSGDGVFFVNKKEDVEKLGLYVGGKLDKLLIAIDERLRGE